MKPKEKAKELVDKVHIFTRLFVLDPHNRCARFIPEEILKELEENFDSLHCSDRKEYWNKVIKEIEKLCKLP